MGIDLHYTTYTLWWLLIPFTFLILCHMNKKLLKNILSFTSYFTHFYLFSHFYTFYSLFCYFVFFFNFPSNLKTKIWQSSEALNVSFENFLLLHTLLFWGFLRKLSTVVLSLLLVCYFSAVFIKVKCGFSWFCRESRRKSLQPLFIPKSKRRLNLKRRMFPYFTKFLMRRVIFCESLLFKRKFSYSRLPPEFPNFEQFSALFGAFPEGLKLLENGTLCHLAVGGQLN